MYSGMNGKVILVTGGASGIGKAFVLEAAESGANIIAIDRNPELIEQLREHLPSASHMVLEADVTNSDQVKSIVSGAVSRFGRLDGCFNNAGIAAPFQDIADTPDDLFDRVVKVNQYGSFYVLKHVMNVMRQQQAGTIVCTSSTSGIRGVPAYGAYCASKHAVIGLMKSASLDGAKYGVRVNAICPGMTDTPINLPVHLDWNADDPDAAMKAVASRIPLSRYATPGEIAACAAFLLSDAASYITGQVINVDGGVTAGPGF